MQLLRERFEKEALHFIPCWVEMDDITLSIYEMSDELPLVLIFNKNIESVSPSPLEPEGHVFEIGVRPQSTYRLAATDQRARREWIKVIEEYTRPVSGIS
jgi:hypothetical protein